MKRESNEEWATRRQEIIYKAVKATVEAIRAGEKQVGFEGWFAMQPVVIDYLNKLGYHQEFHYNNTVRYPALWWD